jgi:hypothetical protein
LRAEQVVDIGLNNYLVCELELMSLQLGEVLGILLVLLLLFCLGEQWLLVKNGFFILLDVQRVVFSLLALVWHEVSQLPNLN